MPRRKRIPVVGAKGLNVAQLSPEVRRILARRAKRAARREYAPILRADREAFGDARRDYRAEASSVRGATRMVENSLTQALRGLKGSGLKGGYLRQTQKALTSRQGDAAAAIPFLLADAAATRGEAISDARTQLRTDRASRDSAAASQFNALLKGERTKASGVLGARAEEKGGLELDPLKLKNAEFALKVGLEKWSQNVPVKVNGEEVPFQTANSLETPAQWREFVMGLTESFGGFNAAEALEVVRRFRAKRKRQLSQVREHRRGFQNVAPLVKKLPPYTPFAGR